MSSSPILQAGNLEDALVMAIRYLAETEKRYGAVFKSAQRAGFEANLAALRAGQPITICYEGYEPRG